MGSRVRRVPTTTSSGGVGSNQYVTRPKTDPISPETVAELQSLRRTMDEMRNIDIP